jgi:hypothetical protein
MYGGLPNEWMIRWLLLIFCRYREQHKATPPTTSVPCLYIMIEYKESKVSEQSLS